MSRETTIQVRVSHEEKALIKKNAEDFGLSPSNYLRSQGLYSRPDTPVPHETGPDVANKAKVCQAVENEEPYEVKIVPGTARPDKDDWVRQRAKSLVREKKVASFQAAYPIATEEWEALPND